MPKETKKFINPLLRPSQQEVEPKQEKTPKQERSTPATAVQASKVQSPAQVVEQEEKPEPMPPDPPAIVTTEPRPHIVSTNGSSAQTRTAKTVKHITDPEQQIANGQENGVSVVEQGSNHVQTYEPQAETLRAHPNQTLIRPETPPYSTHVSTATMEESAIAELKESAEAQELADIDVDESDYDDYEPEVNFASTTTKSRRKKGEQAFEKTHVRFTVWVDKNLKQSFEDLAFQRDKPKTTLLNEAIADLVHKYETH